MPKATVYFLAPLMLLSLPAHAQLSLEIIEKLVRSSYAIPHLTCQYLGQQMASADSAHYLLFDTRAPEEYSTSHIRSAIQVEPELSAEEFMKTHGAALKDKHAVFYCSVGYRSSIFARRVQAEVLRAGARSVANLRGGIFRWYNEAHPVVDANGETDNIHPYDSFWRVLIHDRKKDKRKNHDLPQH